MTVNRIPAPLAAVLAGPISLADFAPAIGHADDGHGRIAPIDS